MDAEALHRTVLHYLRQYTFLENRREKLSALLEQRLKPVAKSDVDRRDKAIKKLIRLQQALQTDQLTAKRRMAVEKDDQRYQAIAAEFDRLSQELNEVSVQLRAVKEAGAPPANPFKDGDVAVAMKHLEQFDEILDGSAGRSAVRDMLNKLDLNVGLRFLPAIKGKERVVRKLAGGMIVFGKDKLPVLLHGKDRVDGIPIPGAVDSRFGSKDQNPRSTKGDAKDGDGDPKRSKSSKNCLNGRREGVSFTKVKQGDSAPPYVDLT